MTENSPPIHSPMICLPEFQNKSKNFIFCLSGVKFELDSDVKVAPNRLKQNFHHKFSFLLS